MSEEMNIVKESESETIKMITMGFDKATIYKSLVNRRNGLSNTEKELVKDVVFTVCDEYPDYEIIQKIVRSKIIQDIQTNDDNLVTLDPVTNMPSTVSKRVLKSLFNPKFDFGKQTYTAKFDYNPFMKQPLSKDSEYGWLYNLYQPPKWLHNHFYFGKELDEVTSYPRVYDTFLNHLVAGDMKSKEYILDWISNAIQARNYCILTTIGNQGIGKGLLGEIMRRIFGDSNYNSVKDEIFKSKFNSQLLNKRLVYLDEVAIKQVEHENKLKLLVNDYVEIEQKGIDAKEVKNFTSYYLSSNNLDSIRLSGDDRRFSIVNLTEDKLITTMDSDEIGSMLEDKNIELLAKYLYFRKVDKERMLRVFKSDRTQLVMESSLNVWEEWFIEDYCFKHSGKEMYLKDVASDIANEFILRNPPGRSRFFSLEDKFRDKNWIKLKLASEVIDGKKKRVWKIKIENREEWNV